MKAVITNLYGESAAQDLNNNVFMRETRKGLPPSRSTKGFDRRNEMIKGTLQSSQKELFKIKKYENVQSKTNTGRKSFINQE
jgi:hypothetical protein